MNFLLKNKFLTLGFLLFIFINILLYVFILGFHQTISFNKFNYSHNAHHYLKDPRINGGSFDFLRSLGQYDAQWYLKIASEGYPKNPKNTDINNKTTMNGLSFAFFPLYPLILHTSNYLFKNIELTAFAISNVFLILNFFSLYFVISSLYSKPIAIKSIFLLFLFPFSIFYRSYFAEGLFLLFLIWFSYFLIKKKFTFATISLSLLNVIKGNGYLLNFLLLFYVWRETKKGSMDYKKASILTIILIFPFLVWIIFNIFNTGNPLYFFSVRSAWFQHGFIAPLYNLMLVFASIWFPLHSFHASRVEVFIVLTSLIVLIKSRKSLKREFWWISFLLWLSPLLITDFMSFTRYQIVSFPLFIILAMKLKFRHYLILLTLFAIFLFIISLYFVNWYWIG